MYPLFLVKENVREKIKGKIAVVQGRRVQGKKANTNRHSKLKITWKSCR